MLPALLLPKALGLWEPDAVHSKQQVVEDVVEKPPEGVEVRRKRLSGVLEEVDEKVQRSDDLETLVAH